MTHSVTASVANNTATVHGFDTERFDTDNMHSTSSNTSRLTATTAGKYIISGHIEFASNATGRRQIGIRLNGTTFIGFQEWDTNQSSVTLMSITTLYALAATDYVELRVFQTSGGPLDSGKSSNWAPEFMMVWVAP